MNDDSNTTSWPRRLGVLLAVLLVALPLLGLAVHAYGRMQWERASAAFEDDFGSLDFARFERPAPPEGENAGEWLLAGAAAIVWSEESKKQVNELARSDDWTPEQVAFARGLLDANRGAVETLAKAVPWSESHFGIRYSDGFEAEIPDFLSLYAAGRLLACRARLALLDEDLPTALESLRTLGRLIDTLYDEPTLITQLVGVALERFSLQVMVKILTRPDAPLDDVAALVRTRDVAAEGRLLLPIDTAVAADALRRGYRQTEAFDLAPGFVLEGYLLGDLRAVAELRKTRRLMDVVSRPFGEDPASYEDCEASNLANAAAKFQALMAQRQLVLTALDVRRRGLADGVYPEAIPREPDAFTGRPLVRTAADGGGVRLAVDGGDALDARIRPTGGLPPPAVWEVVLPPLVGSWVTTSFVDVFTIHPDGWAEIRQDYPDGIERLPAQA